MAAGTMEWSSYLLSIGYVCTDFPGSKGPLPVCGLFSLTSSVVETFVLKTQTAFDGLKQIQQLLT